MPVIIETYCGLSCQNCEGAKNGQCKGCMNVEGKPCHEECEIAQCAVSKGIRFCGECGEFPCDLLKKYSFDEQNGDQGQRIKNCEKMKATLVAEARVGIDPVSVCGHHCDYCFLGQWCGGCRSSYNCCSYATISENNICPNVSCSGEKGFDGCYDCPDIMACKKGYYSNENEYVAKATALFIHEYGKECYTTTLKKAIDAGENYPKSFDAKGSVERALALLKSYLA